MNAINKEVIILTGAGQIGMAIARRLAEAQYIATGKYQRYIARLSNGKALQRKACYGRIG